MSIRSIKEIQDEKRAFVKQLKQAILKLGYITNLEYRAFNYSEFVRIEWECCGNDYICVTGNSREAILAEITRDIYKGSIRPVGLIRNSEHIKLLDAQFRNADEKERDDEKKSDA